MNLFIHVTNRMSEISLICGSYACQVMKLNNSLVIKSKFYLLTAKRTAKRSTPGRRDEPLEIRPVFFQKSIHCHLTRALKNN